MVKQTSDLTTNYDQLSKTSNNLESLGLVVRYDTISYRGYEINFLSDPAGVHCAGQWEGELIDLGLNNIYYKEDMCKYIDRRLDLITDFRDSPNFVGAKLEYFNNNDFRDIRLLYKGRILKVFLITGPVDEIWLISESKRILSNSGLLDNEFENV